MGTFILVLGQSLLSGGVVPSTLQARIRAAVALHIDLSRAVLIVSGGDTNNTGRTEAQAMQELLLGSNCVKASDIRLEQSALNTIENVQNTISIIRSEGGSDSCCLHVVTSSFHLPRALYIAEAVLASEKASWVTLHGHGASDGIPLGPTRPNWSRPREINEWRLGERLDHELRITEDRMEQWLRQLGIQPPPPQRRYAAISEIQKLKAQAETNLPSPPQVQPQHPSPGPKKKGRVLQKCTQQ